MGSVGSGWVGEKTVQFRQKKPPLNKNAKRIPVVHGCKGLVTLLPCCVPNFKLNALLISKVNDLSGKGGFSFKFATKKKGKFIVQKKCLEK